MKRLLTLTPVVVTAALLVPAATGSSAASAPYEPDDVLIVDADTPPVSHAVLFKIDPESGARTVLHNFGGSSPNAVAVESDGSILVTDTAAGTDPSGGTNEWGVLYRLRPDPATGQLTRTILTDFGEGLNTGRFPRAVAVEADGQILVLNGSGGTTVVVERPVLVRIDPNTGARSIVSDFGNRSQNGHPNDPPTCTTSCLGVEPRGLAVEADGRILVIDAQAGQGETGNGQGVLFRVDPQSGVRTRLSNFGIGANQGDNPSAVAVEASGQILVTDEGHTSTTPLGLLFRVDPQTGARTVVSDFNTGANTGREPEGVALEGDGQILVVDKHAGPFTRGMLFRVDPASGARQIVSDFGAGANQGGDPLALAVVPPPPPSGPCITLSEASLSVSGTASTPSTRRVVGAEPNYAISNCGSLVMHVAARGADAVGAAGRWRLEDTYPSPPDDSTCSFGVNAFRATVTLLFGGGGVGIGLSTSNRMLVGADGQTPFVLDAAATQVASASIEMPCAGSVGIGEPMTMNITFTAVGP
jgi:sugar lactone lactonase YvrE